MKCSNCGNKIKKGSAFCINCGTPVNEKKEKPKKEKVKKEKTKKKHPIRNFFVFIFFIALIGGGVFAYFTFIGFRSIKLEDWDGTVDLERNGKGKELFEGLKLVANDRVTTGEEGNVMLLIDTDKELVASENTRFSIKASGITNNGKVTIKLEYGSALASIDKKLSEHSEFEIKTPNATCSVRGTTFNVAYDRSASKTRVDVTTGVVHVEAGKNSLDLNAGESAEVVDELVTPVSNKPWTDRADILPSMQPGGYVEFGAYEQDGDLNNGPEPIEWEIFSSDDNGTMLVSRYVLDAQSYNDSKRDVTWETSPLRTWLNEDFMNNAFTDAEKQRINSAYIENPDNEKYETKGGNDTTDKVFLLSTDDVLGHYDFIYYDDNRKYGTSEQLIIAPTEYAKQQGIEGLDITEEVLRENSYDVFQYSDFVGRTGTWWWLRSPGYTENTACCVSGLGAAGWLNIAGNSVDNLYGIRPALYIKDSFDEESPKTDALTDEDDPDAEDAQDADAEKTTPAEEKPEEETVIEENPDFVPADEETDNSEVRGRWKIGNMPYYLELNSDWTCSLEIRGKDKYGTFHYSFDGSTITFDIKTEIGSSLTFTGIQLRADELESPYNLMMRY